jgi:predicted RND superfamily exporter protein
MTREPPIIDMLPDGSFRDPPRRGGNRPIVPLPAKLVLAAVAIAAIGLSILVAAVAIWVVSMLLPVVILAAAAAYGLFRFQRWQMLRRQAGAVRSPWQQGPFR